MLPPWLTDEEIADMTRPLVQAAARKRYLKREGIPFTEKPNGDPVVMRADLDRAKGQAKKSKPQPNRAALLGIFKAA